MRLTQILAVANGEVSAHEPLSHYDPTLNCPDDQIEEFPLFEAMGLTSFINEKAEEIVV